MATLILTTISHFILLVIEKIGYVGIFVLMIMQSVNIPIPSEVIMPFSGFLAEKGVFIFWIVVLVGALGNMVGSLISYGLASYLLRDGLREKYPVLGILINFRNLKLAEDWFRKYGAPSIFIGRLIPVVSTFISFPAGFARMDIYKFSALTFAGSFIWSTILTKLGFILGENWQILQIYFRKFDYLILAVVFLLSIWWILEYLRDGREIKN